MEIFKKFWDLREGDTVFVIEEGETADNIKKFYVQSIYPWDDYRETYALTIKEEDTNKIISSLEVYGYKIIEENVDDTPYTIATDKSLILEMPSLQPKKK